MTPQTRSRLVLLLIAVMFLSSFGVAFYLRMSGWEPAQTRNHGELLDPPLDLRDRVPRRADGSDYAWQPQQRHWRVVVAPPADCDQPCEELVDALQRVWIGVGRHADRLEVLWFGELPSSASSFRALQAMDPASSLVEALPEAAGGEGLAVYLIDPSGFLVMRYPPGFDPAGLRKDLARLLK
jgi:hypothetical protein